MSPRAGVPAGGVPLRLRGRVLAPDRAAVMAVVNRTPDSFYPGARSTDDDGALWAVERAVAEGADLVDIGGVRAGRGPEVGVQEETDRVVPLVGRVRAAFPDLPVSVDTWRAEVALAAATAGADLLNDTWGGHDPDLVGVAARCGVGLVCSHTGGLPPRTDPWRPAYPVRHRRGDAGDDHPDDRPDRPADDAQDVDPVDGVLQDVLETLRASAARAVAAGIHPQSVLVDPTHDFGKTTWHSLHLARRTGELTALGHPLLMALSRKDFIGESLDLPVGERLEGTLAVTAVAVWQGATVVRTHDVRATRRVLEMVAVLRGDRPPARATRGLV